MFENLSERLSGVFDRLTKQGALGEEDVKAALREVRTALLEADVSLPVARDFVKRVQAKATGQAVTKSVTPGQQVIKIVHDELVATLAGDASGGQADLVRPLGDVVLAERHGEGPEAVGLDHVGTGPEERLVQIRDDVRAGHRQDVGAALEVRPAEIIGGEAELLQVGAGRTVVHDDTVVDEIEEAAHR